MRTDFPTIALYFVFAFTHCKLTVYADNEAFARRVLETKGVEFLTESDNENWQTWSTHTLLAVICETLPEMLSNHFAEPRTFIKGLTE